MGVGAVAGATANRLEQPEVVVVLKRADGQAREPGEFVDMVSALSCCVTHNGENLSDAPAEQNVQLKC